MLMTFRNYKLSLFQSGNFKIFNNALGQFISDCPLKHVIISRNLIALITLSAEILTKLKKSVYTSGMKFVIAVILEWSFYLRITEARDAVSCFKLDATFTKCLLNVLTSCFSIVMSSQFLANTKLFLI